MKIKDIEKRIDSEIAYAKRSKVGVSSNPDYPGMVIKYYEGYQKALEDLKGWMEFFNEKETD